MQKQTIPQLIDNRYKITINHPKSSIIVIDFQSSNVYKGQQLSFKYLDLMNIQNIINTKPTHAMLSFKFNLNSLELIITINSPFIQSISQNLILNYFKSLDLLEKGQQQIKFINKKLEQIKQANRSNNIYYVYKQSFIAKRFQNVDYDQYNQNYYVQQQQQGDQIFSIELIKGTYLLTFSYFQKLNQSLQSFYISFGNNYQAFNPQGVEIVPKVNQWVPLLMRKVYTVSDQKQLVKVRGSRVELGTTAQLKNIILTARKI